MNADASLGWFVTGTDTGIGKTWVSCLMLRHWAAQGRRAAGFKPVASGCRRTPDGLRNEDAEALMAASSVALPYAGVNPVALEPAIAPHLAAAEAGVVIEPEVLARDIRRAAAGAGLERLVVEGVGGWSVPLGPAGDLPELARALGLPVLLVVGVRLGCLNHALLTAEAVERSGLLLAGWVANLVEPDLPRLQGNLETLATRLPAPCLGTVPLGARTPDEAPLLLS
ncbi:dethiobiotin synthase [Thiohalobacter sp.]|uniref:dethiobiotin synthase n=1 Tax=Thiohalobacter sp. TaxID=2025948 RepID=UPI002620DB0B|nr:dethiobiotin synthase [Thiohalobacter sp.]